MAVEGSEFLPGGLPRTVEALKEDSERLAHIAGRRESAAILLEPMMREELKAFTDPSKRKAELLTMLWSGHDAWGPYIQAALVAEYCLKRDVDYILRDDQIVILDPGTGRQRLSTRWQYDTHQVPPPSPRPHANHLPTHPQTHAITRA